MFYSSLFCVDLTKIQSQIILCMSQWAYEIKKKKSLDHLMPELVLIIAIGAF